MEVIGSLRDFDGFVGVRTKCEQIVSRLRCRAGGTDNCAIIPAQDVNPAADIVGVAYRRPDAKRGADERACYFRDELLLCV